MPEQFPRKPLPPYETCDACPNEERCARERTCLIEAAFPGLMPDAVTPIGSGVPRVRREVDDEGI